MKITDKHVSDPTLNWLIEHFDIEANIDEFAKSIADALLELKQRRAEDRHREANG